MNISLEVSYKSLCKQGEELCGDKLEIIKTEDSDIIIFVGWYGQRCQSKYSGDADIEDSRYHAQTGRQTGRLRRYNSKDTSGVQYP